MLPAFPPEPVTLAVVYPHRRLLPAKVKAFADFMVDEVGRAVAADNEPAWPGIVADQPAESTKLRTMG